jgi:hypothetical protein
MFLVCFIRNYRESRWYEQSQIRIQDLDFQDLSKRVMGSERDWDATSRTMEPVIELRHPKIGMHLTMERQRVR